jgi:hypothetical protein
MGLMSGLQGSDYSTCDRLQGQGALNCEPDHKALEPDRISRDCPPSAPMAQI